MAVVLDCKLENVLYCNWARGPTLGDQYMLNVMEIS
jgi:hypothetical protein